MQADWPTESYTGKMEQQWWGYMGCIAFITVESRHHHYRHRTENVEVSVEDLKIS